MLTRRRRSPRHHPQGDGKLFVGVYVQNGRLKGEPKTALRAIIESYGIPVRSAKFTLACHGLPLVLSKHGVRQS